MNRITGILARIKNDRASRRAAKRLSRQLHPGDWIHRAWIVERNPDSLIIAVEYYGTQIPMRCRFFRVIENTVADECPPGFSPRGWVPRR